MTGDLTNRESRDPGTHRSGGRPGRTGRDEGKPRRTGEPRGPPGLGRGREGPRPEPARERGPAHTWISLLASRTGRGYVSIITGHESVVPGHTSREASVRPRSPGGGGGGHLGLERGIQRLACWTPSSAGPPPRARSSYPRCRRSGAAGRGTGRWRELLLPGVRSAHSFCASPSAWSWSPSLAGAAAQLGPGGPPQKGDRRRTEGFTVWLLPPPRRVGVTWGALESRCAGPDATSFISSRTVGRRCHGHRQDACGPRC